MTTKTERRANAIEKALSELKQYADSWDDLDEAAQILRKQDRADLADGLDRIKDLIYDR